jgi:septation ring formation regulator EzrA
MAIPNWFLAEEATFRAKIKEQRFEDLKSIAQQATDLIGDQNQVGLDNLALMVQRVRMVVEECQGRITAVRNDLKRIGGDEPEAALSASDLDIDEEPF